MVQTDIQVIPNLKAMAVDTLPTNNSNSSLIKIQTNKHTVHHPLKLLLVHLPELDSTTIPPLLLYLLSPLPKGVICQDGTMLLNSLLLPSDLNQQQKNINQHPSCLPSLMPTPIRWRTRVRISRCHPLDHLVHRPETNRGYYLPHQKVVHDHHQLRL
jgi:hypothetical protein